MLAAGGERDAQDRRGLLRVLEEQLVEVAHAEEYQRVRLAGLGLEVLRHDRRGAGGGSGVAVGVWAFIKPGRLMGRPASRTP